MNDLKKQTSSYIIGKNSVTEALKNERAIDKIYISQSNSSTLAKVIALAKTAGIPVIDTPTQRLDLMSDGKSHQGVVAIGAGYEFSTLEDIFNKAGDQPPFIIIADEIEDPHNLGAIIRTAEAAGAHGIIIPKRRGVGLTETVAKTSSGAIEYMPVVRVSNLVSTIKELKEKNIWVYGADMNGQSWCSTDFSGGVALVIGSEGKGVSRLVKENCDMVISIPMVGKINSLNASVAGGILMYEVCRQRLNLKSK